MSNQGTVLIGSDTTFLIIPALTYTSLRASMYFDIPEFAPRITFIVQTTDGSVIGQNAETSTTISIIGTEK